MALRIASQGGLVVLLGPSSEETGRMLRELRAAGGRAAAFCIERWSPSVAEMLDEQFGRGWEVVGSP